MLPDEQRLERFMVKLKEKRQVSEDGRVRELVSLKMVLDLKIAFLLASERPRL